LVQDHLDRDHFSLSRMGKEKTTYARQRELHTHGDDDQPHEPRCRVAQKATGCVTFPAGNENHHDPHYHRGHRDRDQRRDRQQRPGMATASVMTPVIVPGLAANNIRGVSDAFSSAFSSAPSFAVSWAGAELALNMVKPIHDSTPPPATEKASSDTPKSSNSLAPIRAVTPE
jgi:hypothetical protein